MNIPQSIVEKLVAQREAALAERQNDSFFDRIVAFFASLFGK